MNRARYILTQDRLRELLSYDPETGDFTWLIERYRVKPGMIAGFVHNSSACYRHIKVDGTRYPAHRLAWLYVYGEWPKTDHMDHINGIKYDNRWCNLREATPSQNGANRHGSCGSAGLRGVSFHKRIGLWQARIMFNRKSIHLGYFTTPEVAHAVYLKKKRELHGEFARSG